MNAQPLPRTAARLAWCLLALLAFAVAFYALVIASLSEQRAQLSPFAAQLVDTQQWRALLHFVTGGIVLAVGVLQFSARLRTRQPIIHRWLGRIYVAGVLGSGIAGLVLAVRTSSGLVASSGFTVLALLWLATTVQAYRKIRAGHLAQHRAWMLRSYALTLAAVTLRIYLPLSQLAGMPFMTAYPLIAWASWIPNLLFVEWWARRSTR